jgi:hypothetical protein
MQLEILSSASFYIGRRQPDNCDYRIVSHQLPPKLPEAVKQMTEASRRSADEAQFPTPTPWRGFIINEGSAESVWQTLGESKIICAFEPALIQDAEDPNSPLRILPTHLFGNHYVAERNFRYRIPRIS